MMQTRFYFLQFAGILILLCGYLLSDQPDSWSVMHFNPNPAVFSKAIKTDSSPLLNQKINSSESGPYHHTETPKIYSGEVVLPGQVTLCFHDSAPLSHTTVISVRYLFLFYKEINPPPPSAC